MANALGYAWILIAVGLGRELFGAGTILGYNVLNAAEGSAAVPTYVNNGLMVLAPGAFLLLGIIIWIQRAISGISENY